MATKTFKIGLSDADKAAMAQDVYERVLALTFAEYDSSETYNTGDFVVYNDVLYQCKEDGVTGVWNSSKWETATLQDLLDDAEAAMAAVSSKAEKSYVDANLNALQTKDNSLQNQINNNYNVLNTKIDNQDNAIYEELHMVEADTDKISHTFYSNNYVVRTVAYVSGSVLNNTLTIVGTVSSNKLSVGQASLNFYTKAQVDEFGKSLVMTLDENYVLTVVLKDANGNVLSTQTANLPLDSLIVDGSYDSDTESIILELDGGTTITIPVADLVSGLVSQDYLEHNYYSKSQSDTKFATKTEFNNLQSDVNSLQYEIDNLASLLNNLIDNFVAQHKLYSKTTTVVSNTATISGIVSGNTLVLAMSV